MIGRRAKRKSEDVEERPKGYDDFHVRLGDNMRGERATMGKSLLDVQRELRIRAAYIAAIENCDPSAFETPGFIAGYVRSYARYLNMDPEEAFAKFCEESGFSTAHGMSAAASTIRKKEAVVSRGPNNDPFATPNMPFAPAQDSILSRVEPRAIGSSLILVALIGAIGYGGWSVLNEIQRVTLAPVEQAPVVLTDLDPVSSATTDPGNAQDLTQTAGMLTPPSEALDRLYRPQALDVPVLVARDAPISQLSPDVLGLFTPEPSVLASVSPVIESLPVPKVIEDGAPEMVIMAVRPAWVRVRSAQGTVLFEKILDAGEEYVLPATEEAPTLRAGMSGSVYFKLNGEIFGPAGEGTGTVRDLALSIEEIEKNFELADMTRDPALARIAALTATQSADLGEE
ncbi:helix-turn-helix domain-containing protein [Shimia sp. Alg240-R146]|uniref:helix-turn-helix domain-containing protein n=1 Tax=Shimia sp. Alg240-R146 TaxID=2993449 RepID=UPI0022E712CB|nr:helix-turn-helix domain-containing protein [Shimia sp. Alg240-R146]